MTTTYNMAMYLARHGIYYYPTAHNSKIGLKGTHGFNDAVNNESMAKRWFQGTNNNIGINLRKSHLMVVDVDTGHDSKVNGKHNLFQLFKKYGRLPDDTLIEKTPRGGIHYFLKIPDNLKLKNTIGAFQDEFKNSGIDLMITNVLIAPSIVHDKPYKLVSGSYGDIKPAPKWILDNTKREETNGIKNTDHSNRISNISYSKRTKKYTGKLIDELMEGTVKDYRNTYFTRILGSMLAVGTKPENAALMMQLVNDNCVNIPLPDSELRTIFRSVYNRECRRTEVN